MPRRKHVLIVVQNMPVPLDRRVWLECQSLVAAGYDVSVICPKGPGEPSYEARDGVQLHKYRAVSAARGVLAYGTEFLYCWIRALLLTWRIHRRNPIDAIQACNPPDTYWALGRIFKRFGTKFVFDHHDLCPELYESKPGPHRPVIARTLRWLERKTYDTADLLLTTNESYRSVACARTGHPASEAIVIRSGPDPDSMRAGEPRPELRRGRAHLACYLGLMNPQDGVDLVVRVADVVVHEMGRDDIQFGVLGYGDCLDELRQLTTELALDDHVTFTGRAELPTITDWLSTADVGIGPDPYTLFNDLSTMNKTLEYLAFGLPVVAFELTETVVSAGPAATYVAPSSDKSDGARRLAIALVELIDDPQRRAKMGAIGRARIEESLGWPVSAANYVAAYGRLLQ
ncbi:MAG TPA: glycosyltransferase family 4 protein [Acidimicrobiales bacterium]